MKLHLSYCCVLQVNAANAEVVNARVVADEGQVFRPPRVKRLDQVLRDAAQAESSHE